MAETETETQHHQQPKPSFRLDSMASFSFGFGGDDIEDDTAPVNNGRPEARPEPGPGHKNAPASAFPVAGKHQLPPSTHSLQDMLYQLPSKIAFDTLDISLDGADFIQLPRRELWDVKLQVQAEEAEDDETTEGLGEHDVKTGIYEGGFKSWESSVDLVKVLNSEGLLAAVGQRPLRVIELGCGTALPSLALFSRAADPSSKGDSPLSLLIADYNPSVLELVTLPNFILAWALMQRHTTDALQNAFDLEDELELTPEVRKAFEDFLVSKQVSLQFLSGGWSDDFVELVDKQSQRRPEQETLILGAETIYSPFAQEAFTETIFQMMLHEKSEQDATCQTLVAAKRMYFGVGGSLDDFIEKAKTRGAIVSQLREETDGVRRGVVRCAL